MMFNSFLVKKISETKSTELSFIAEQVKWDNTRLATSNPNKIEERFVKFLNTVSAETAL